jgi:hypothetical protein
METRNLSKCLKCGALKDLQLKDIQTGKVYDIICNDCFNRFNSTGNLSTIPK